MVPATSVTLNQSTSLVVSTLLVIEPPIATMPVVAVDAA